MKSWKTDVAVLLIFFVRDDVFSKTFEAVKKARPRTLLLFQDGPREGRPDDIEGIKRCREIAEAIDWDCTVYRNYQDKNWACDPATFYSHKWAFSLVDKCIILEDDCVPTQSFFPFCKELLDKYENDLRISKIAGMNNLGIFEECPDDYFFCNGGSCGWATWKRVADQWEEDYGFCEDAYSLGTLKSNMIQKYGTRNWKDFFNKCLWQKKSGKPFWESINSFQRVLNNQLCIVPKRNMICNIGVSENATHSVSNVKLLSKASQRFFATPAYECNFPLKHPKYVIENVDYSRKLAKNRSIFSKVDSIFRRLISGNYKSIIVSIKRRLNNDRI